MFLLIETKLHHFSRFVLIVYVKMNLIYKYETIDPQYNETKIPTEILELHIQDKEKTKAISITFDESQLAKEKLQDFFAFAVLLHEISFFSSSETLAGKKTCTCQG